MPLSQFLGILLLIQNNNHPSSVRDDLMSASVWLERVDQFFDNALPVHFVFTSNELPRLVQMNVSAAVSGLWKTLESFRELKMLSQHIDELRHQVDDLEQQIRR
jgi:hypothetical protein